MLSCWLLQVVTVWLHYMSILGNVNIPVPGTVHWVFSVASFAFSSITSGSLSLDCLIRAGPLRPALKRLLVHLAVPVINLLLLSTWQLFWLVPGLKLAISWGHLHTAAWPFVKTFDIVSVAFAMHEHFASCNGCKMTYTFYAMSA